jgi:hypothetical protein
MQNLRRMGEVYKTKRLSLVLTPMEKAVVEQLADSEGGLSQSALVQRLIRNAARDRGIWPPDKQWPAAQRVQGVQRG